jgi:CRISPR-associated endonuclease/helicase Cas3
MNGDKIPESLRPKSIDYLMAKSADQGGDSLAQHTWDVIRKLADQHRLRPHLATQLQDERLWHRLYWASFFHDFGKAAQGFQERLQNPQQENEWSRGHHRHEVLSLAFVEWLFPPGHADRLPVLCAVICHHKDAEVIFEKYGRKNRNPDAMRRVEFLASQITSKVADDLWLWLAEYGAHWAQAIGLPILESFAPINRKSFGVEAICRAIDEFSLCMNGYDDGDYDERRVLADMHYRGLILTADHAASAGAESFPDLNLTPDIAAHPLPSPNSWRSHQRDAAQAGIGSAIMIAPTGSGKTEAAMLWAARQIEHRPASRLFYTLPYQASMNAMMERLCRNFFQVNPIENGIVTVQHSRALLKFYQDMMEADSGTNPKAATRTARARKNLAKLNYYPVQVFSPYQMLKAAYSLKGYEALLVDYTGGLFIFDEIHAYEASRLALIITMMGWLAHNYGARFLVMTATLPPPVEAALKAALPGCEEIRADTQVFEDSRRHQVHLLDGDLLNSLDVIAERGRHEKVLVCCNQVGRAQEVYQRLQNEHHFTRDNIILLHGRFNGRDRTAKERLLGEIVGVGQPHLPYIIVATQVVEVSLNIDLDTIFTDPAPLEALLQRFGRVNRGRKVKELRPVHVFREPMGETECRPYDLQLVEASLEVLERYCGGGGEIDEALVTQMLGEIYQHDAIAKEWQTKYQHAAQSFQDVLSRMKPYQSADISTFQEFYKLFDGTQVLPADCEKAFYDALDKGDYLGASQYLVNISWGQYAQLKGKSLVVPREEKEYADHVNVPYSEEWGLDIAGALSAPKDEDE